MKHKAIPDCPVFSEVKQFEKEKAELHVANGALVAFDSMVSQNIKLQYIINVG